MSKTYRAAIIGFAHMHINHVASLYARHPRIEWVGCADTAPLKPELSTGRYTRTWNKNYALMELGVPHEFGSYLELLQKEDPDIAVICSENVCHPEIVEACAASKTHVCVEKPMAMSLAHGLRMCRATQAAGTTMIVNWPIAWSPAAWEMKRLIDAGAIGRVLQVKYRAGHTGPLGRGARHQGAAQSEETLSDTERASSWWHQIPTGGGALIDFCCYGAMLSRWFVGEQAQSAMAMKANLNSPWGEADDNGFMLVRYPEAVGLFEGSWTTLDHGVPTGPIVYGTDGTLVMDNRGGNQVVQCSRGSDDIETFDPPALPAGQRDVASALVHHLDSRGPLPDLLTPDLNIEALAILDAGIRSANSGRQEAVGNEVWN